MRKLKLDIDLLAVETFAALDGAPTRSICSEGGWETRLCSVYESYCALECPPPSQGERC